MGGVVGLRVSKQGHKIRYLMRWTRHGVRHDYYLPRDISLTEARKLGAECRYQLDRGEDPRVEHKRREVEAIEKLHKLDAQKSVYLKTFRNVAVEWFEYQRSINAWANNEKGERTAYLRLRKHVYPLIGNRVIQELGVEDAVKVLTPVWKSKNSADKIYQLLRRVFEFAIIKKYYVGVNPIDKRGSLGVLLQPLTLQRTAGENMAALPYERVPDLMCALLNNGTNSALAVAFSILTASRFRAVRLSEWSECELDGEIPLWRIPPEHDKNKGRGIRHIPLSPQALIILQKMKPRKHDKSSFIFPSVRGLALCDSVPSTSFLLHKELIGDLDDFFKEHWLLASAYKELRSFGAVHPELFTNRMYCIEGLQNQDYYLFEIPTSNPLSQCLDTPGVINVNKLLCHLALKTNSFSHASFNADIEKAVLGTVQN